MRWLLLFIGLSGLAATVWLLKPANSAFLQFKNNEVRVCVVGEYFSLPPESQALACEMESVADLKLHHRLLWLEGQFEISTKLIEGDYPIGFFWNAKAASTVFVNGQIVGSNGTPGADSEAEIAGSLDATFFVPKTLVKPGHNSVAILASSHHGLWDSENPLLVARFDQYLQPPYHERGTFWISLLTFGIFLVGAVYFGAIAKSTRRWTLSTTLCLASVFACGQLLVEMSRSLWAYPYPVHEIRMVLVSLFSFGVGAALLTHTLERFKFSKQRVWLIVTGLISVTGLFLIPGFDSKASWAILIPGIAAGVVSIANITPGNQTGRIYSATFAIFVLFILVDPGTFLDRYYYLAVAGVLVSLFIQQAILHKETLANYQQSEIARQRLEVVLDDIQPTQTVFIDVKDTNTVHRVSADDLEWCCSAGDYVALHLSNGRKLLHSDSLIALEELLPNNFLRVHRSSLVNIHCIKDLKRSDSGVGELSMRSGDKVPVSRRIMPRVRRRLSTSNGSDSA